MAGVDEVEHRPHPGRGGCRRGDQDGAWRCGTVCCRRTLHVDEPSPQVDWSAGACPAVDRGAAVAGDGSSAPGGGVVVRDQRHQRPRHPRSRPRRTAAEEAPGERSVAPARCRGCCRADAGGAAGSGRRGCAAHLRATRPCDPVDVGLVAGRRRGRCFEHRAAVVGADRDELLAGLRRWRRAGRRPVWCSGPRGLGGSGGVLVHRAGCAAGRDGAGAV